MWAKGGGARPRRPHPSREGPRKLPRGHIALSPLPTTGEGNTSALRAFFLCAFKQSFRGPAERISPLRHRPRARGIYSASERPGRGSDEVLRPRNRRRSERADGIARGGYPGGRCPSRQRVNPPARTTGSLAMGSRGRGIGWGEAARDCVARSRGRWLRHAPWRLKPCPAETSRRTTFRGKPFRSSGRRLQPLARRPGGDETLVKARLHGIARAEAVAAAMVSPLPRPGSLLRRLDPKGPADTRAHRNDGSTGPRNDCLPVAWRPLNGDRSSGLPRHIPQVMERRSWRGSMTWKCTSSTPPSGSPGRRDG